MTRTRDYCGEILQERYIVEQLLGEGGMGSALLCLSKDPQKRPASALELGALLSMLDGYSQRDEHLTHACSGIAQLTAASGDLGLGAGNGAAVRRSTSRVRDSLGTDARSLGQERQSWLWLGLALGLLFLGATVLSVWHSRPVASSPEATQAQERSLAPREAESGDVRVELRGVPSGALLLLDGVRLDSRVFVVKRKLSASVLEVEAKGYERFTASFVPQGDLVIEVALRPSAK